MKLRILTQKAMAFTVTVSLFTPPAAFAADVKVPPIPAASAPGPINRAPTLIYAALLPSLNILASSNSTNDDTGLFPLPTVTNVVTGNGLPAPRPPATQAPGNPTGTSGTASTSPASGATVCIAPAIVPIGGNPCQPGTGSNTGTQPPPATPSNPTPIPGNMTVAKVATEYSCPLFDNNPNADLLSSLDALSAQVKMTTNCGNDGNVQTIQTSNNTIRASIASLQAQMDTTNPTQVDPTAINNSITAAVNAVGNLGSVVNSSAFINSSCGLKTMSKGQVLLALNGVISGLAPYALFAVSASPALAPILPFVVGGSIATSGIAAIAKLMNQNGSDVTMDKPDNRKALVENTCEYMRVAKKVRFLQLAQSGKIQQIDQELQKNITLYSTQFSHPSADLSSKLTYKNSSVKYYSDIQNQIFQDTNAMKDLNTQMAGNNDDQWACVMGNQLVNYVQSSYVQNSFVFPATAFANLDKAVNQNDSNQKMRADALKAMNTLSMQRIQGLYGKIATDDSALKSCAIASRAWVTSINQTIAMTTSDVNFNQALIEKSLSSSPEYSAWSTRSKNLESQKTTVTRVEKVMQELAKDDSIINRSELDQRMEALKDGLFGVHQWLTVSTPPVLSWIQWTKKLHQQSLAQFIAAMKDLRTNSFSMTATGTGKTYIYTPEGPFVDPIKKAQDDRTSQGLGTLTLKNIPVGSRQHEIACQSLQNTWIHWSEAITYMGSIQFFCDMIDSVLDVTSMDAELIRDCRGTVDYGGFQSSPSLSNSLKAILTSKGYSNDANLVSAKLQELQCPMDSINVMTN